MDVLIVTKITNYELYGTSTESKVARGLVSQDALDRLKIAHQEHHATLDQLKATLDSHKIAFEQVSREDETPIQVSDRVVVTVGGDGTLLAASHRMPQGGVLIGIRSSQSSVGYLCCAGPGQVGAVVQSIKERRVGVEKIPRLKAQVYRAESGDSLTTMPILNDFLYANAHPAATTRYRLTFGDVTELHRSSGIWIATGIGSTAAIFAAMGEKRPSHDPLVQYRVRELYRLSNPPPQLDGGLFDPEMIDFEIENRSQHAILALDGQYGVEKIHYGDRIRFLPASYLKLGRTLMVP
jgi:NAD+ kinase